MRSARAVLLLLTLALCLALAASAQTPPPIVQTQRIVSGNLALNSGANANNSLVRIQLSYCGGNAGRVIAADGSVTIISFQPFDVRPSSSGTPPQGLPWSTPLYGNDQIWCGVQQGVSRWRITPINNGVSGDAVDYQVNSCAAYTTLNAGAACDAVTTASFFDVDSAPLCIGGGNPGTRTYDCALHFPYVVPPPPPVQGPPGPQGPPGTSGANPGTAPQVAYYSATGNQVSGDPRFTDNATTLAYQGDAYVRGSQTIDTMLYVNGAYYMDTTPTISPMAPAPAGRSAMGVSSDYNFYISANGGTPAKICTQGDATCGGGGSGNVSPGTPTYMAIYTAATQVGSDPNFYDTSGTLSYLGNSYTQGNDTVDNILYVNGAYYMDTTPSASPVVAAPSGRSSMGVSTDGNFYISNNSPTPVAAGAPQQICTTGNGACPTGTTLPSGQVGDILRYNVNGDGAWDAVNYSGGFVTLQQLQSQALFSVGVTNNSGTSDMFNGGENDIAATPTSGSARQPFSSATASTVTVVGMKTGQSGNSSQVPMLPVYRFSAKFAAGNTTNVRYWLGMGCWANASSHGTNGTPIFTGTSGSAVGTTKYASDTPNSSTIGFRFSAGTDTHWQAVVITGGTGQTTVDTGVSIDLNPHVFEYAPNITGTAITFFIDRVAVGTISTNLPPPSAGMDSNGDLFWTADNKNTATSVSGFFYWMYVSLK